MVTRRLGKASLEKYELVEMINAPNGDFVLIFMDKTNTYPSIFAQVRYIKHNNNNRMFAMFKAEIVDKELGLNVDAADHLEFQSITIAEGIRKCLCANDVMTST